MTNNLPKIVICEGLSEYAYIQELNRLLIRGRYSTPYIPALPESGNFSSITKEFKNQKKKNKNSDVLIWVDKDIYVRQKADSTKYSMKKSYIPDFLFSVWNFEDFLVLHKERKEILFWQEKCSEFGHLSHPCSAEEHLKLFRKYMFPDYEKGTLPFDLTRERIELLFSNLKMSDYKFSCEFLEFVQKEIQNKTLRFIR